MKDLQLSMSEKVERAFDSILPHSAGAVFGSQLGGWQALPRSSALQAASFLPGTC